MKGTTRIGIGAAAGAAVAAALAFGGLLGGSGETGSAAQPPADIATEELLAGFAVGQTAAQIRDLERRAAADARDADARRLLGLAYQQRARETGDPAYLDRSQRALERVLELAPADPVATTGLAALAASRHDFRLALRLAQSAVRLDPSSAAAQGILGDALLELGRYREAFAAFDRMAALEPTLASYARISYARELLGDTRGAFRAMRLAVDAGGGVPEHAAWTLVQFGNLELHRGRLGRAARAYRAAQARLPGYVAATVGLADVHAARGEVDRAVRLYREALDRTPLPEFAAATAVALRSVGREAEAREADLLVDELVARLAAHGVRTDLEAAEYDLDAGRRLPRALALARAAYRERPSVEAAHVLAYALLQNGRCREARTYSDEALRLGTRDADSYVHRSGIERCLGNEAAAQRSLREARAIDPWVTMLPPP